MADINEELKVSQFLIGKILVEPLAPSKLLNTISGTLSRYYLHTVLKFFGNLFFVPPAEPGFPVLLLYISPGQRKKLTFFQFM